MPRSPEEFERVLILAPYGKDGTLIQSELRSAGFSAETCETVGELCREIEKGAGAALIADEALTREAVQMLVDLLAGQPAWSDLPLLVMTSGGASTRASRARLALIEPLPNTSLMERPVRPVTLVSTVKAALRARRRQYQIAEHLAKIEASEHAVRRSEANLRLLSELSEATLTASGRERITAIVVRRLGEYLGVSRCTYGTFAPDSDAITIVSEYTAPGYASLAADGGPVLFGARRYQRSAKDEILSSTT